LPTFFSGNPFFEIGERERDLSLSFPSTWKREMEEERGKGGVSVNVYPSPKKIFLKKGGKNGIREFFNRYFQIVHFFEIRDYK